MPKINLSIQGGEHVFFSSRMSDVWEKTETLKTEKERQKYIFVFSGHAPKRVIFTIRLAARAARAEIVAIYIGQDAMRTEARIEIHHEAPDTFARVLFRAALRDASRVDFSGMLNIHGGADGSDSYLSAHALMLSEKAMARIDPQLEILAHNVKASHGATVGRVGAQELFYLQSRGLARREAERVLVRGFFQEALARMPQDATEYARHLL